MRPSVEYGVELRRQAVRLAAQHEGDRPTKIGAVVGLASTRAGADSPPAASADRLQHVH